MEEVRKCKTCGKEFTPHQHNQLYCNRFCRSIELARKSLDYYYKMKGKTRPKLNSPIKCAICGKEFIKDCANRRYCSEECSHKAKSLRNLKIYYQKKEKGYFEKTCRICGKKFMTRYSGTLYCSEGCKATGAEASRAAWLKLQGKKPKNRLQNRLTEAQLAQRDRLRLEWERRKLLKEVEGLA